MKLSSRLEVQEPLTTFPPPHRVTPLAASRVREGPLRGGLPVPSRPVIGVTVSLDGRHAIDYCGDSLTIGLAPRR
jgi:hypothetical protein